MSELKEIINELKNLLKKYDLTTSFIFGSLANKDKVPYKFNDLDILIVFKDLTSLELKKFKKDIRQFCSRKSPKVYIFPEFRGGPVKKNVVTNKKIIQLHFSIWKNLKEIKTKVRPKSPQWFTILKNYQHLTGTKIESLIKIPKINPKDIFEWPIKLCLEMLGKNKLSYHMLCATNAGVIRRKYNVKATKKEHIATSVYFALQHTKNLLLTKDVKNLKLLSKYFPNFEKSGEISYFIKIRENLRDNHLKGIDKRVVREKAINYLTALHNFVSQSD